MELGTRIGQAGIREVEGHKKCPWETHVLDGWMETVSSHQPCKRLQGSVLSCKAPAAVTKWRVGFKEIHPYARRRAGRHLLGAAQAVAPAGSWRVLG